MEFFIWFQENVTVANSKSQSEMDPFSLEVESHSMASALSLEMVSERLIVSYGKRE